MESCKSIANTFKNIIYVYESNHGRSKCINQNIAVEGEGNVCSSKIKNQTKNIGGKVA